MRTHSLPFGLRQVVLTPIDSSGILHPENAVALPAARTFSFSETEDFEELQGNDTTVASHGAGPVVEWELEGGGISLACWAILAGGTIVESGSTPNGIRTYKKLSTDSRPYFQVEGRAISDNGGDIVGKIYRAKADGDLEAPMENGSFLLTNASGKGFGRESDDSLYDWIERETASPLASATPKTGWSIDIVGTPTSGTFRLSLNGTPTADIAYNANAAAVAAALNALQGLTGLTGITASGTDPIAVTLPVAGVLLLQSESVDPGTITVA